MQGLSFLETFVELVALERTGYYRKYLDRTTRLGLHEELLTPACSGKAKERNERRWYLSSRLLEMLVQIAVLEPIGQARLQASTACRFADELVERLQARYGLVLAPNWPDATIEDYEAFNGNLRHLKARLREIGFYTYLSDTPTTPR